MVEVDDKKCIAYADCKCCVDACPFGCISIDANKKVQIYNDDCLDCLTCVGSCPVGALKEKEIEP